MKCRFYASNVKWTTLLTGLILLICWASFCYASSGKKIKATDYEVKAAYLYNFLLFAQWPDTEKNRQSMGNATVNIGILGEDPFEDNFSKIEGKYIQPWKKILAIHRLGPYASRHDLKQYQILFVCSSEKKNLKHIFEVIKGTPVLSVSDVEGFLEAGGMIRLLNVNNRIRWEINRAPAKKAGLKLSSQLLRNAVRVVEIP